MADNDNLTPAELKLFEDPEIEAAYQGWRKHEQDNALNYVFEVHRNWTRKQFLMRIRFLLQQGKLP